MPVNLLFLWENWLRCILSFTVRAPKEFAFLVYFCSLTPHLNSFPFNLRLCIESLVVFELFSQVWALDHQFKQTFTKHFNKFLHEHRTLNKSASAMSGKGCQLLVSPCSVSPSLSTIRGHHSQSIRMPLTSPQRTNHSPSGRMNKVKIGTIHSLGSGTESHVTLPTLSLRRQVLTNGKHLTIPTASPHLQPQAHHHQNTAVTATTQTRLSSSNSKGNHKKN